MTKEISLTQGRCAIVDDGDYEYLSKFKWCVIKDRNTYYAVRNVKENNKYTLILIHQELIGKREGLSGPQSHLASAAPAGGRPAAGFAGPAPRRIWRPCASA